MTTHQSIMQEGSAADAIKKQLVRALTDSEFAASTALEADDSDGSTPASAAALTVDASFETSAQDSDVPDGAEEAPLQLDARPPILGPPSPPQQTSGAPGQAGSATPYARAGRAAASEQARRPLHQAASTPPSGQRSGGRRLEPAGSAPDTAEQRPAGPAARRHAASRPETQRSKQAAGQTASSGRRDQQGAMACDLLRLCESQPTKYLN